MSILYNQCPIVNYMQYDGRISWQLEEYKAFYDNFWFNIIIHLSMGILSNNKKIQYYFAQKSGVYIIQICIIYI